MTVEITVHNEAETDVLGEILSRLLPDGAIVALNGTLGAGKTRLVQSVAHACGVASEEAGSPTFVLIREYQGERTIYHFDAYRLRNSQEFLELGVEEYFDSDGLSFIEWAELVNDAMPTSRLEVTIEPLDLTSRRLTFTALGDFDMGFESALATQWDERNG
ncbi:MAG: tRNA (adenosine(37)-N6)-threonylcarbamoyltransferase complex ATPase subunit type 1 TsaE [Planctomycetia bacterium]|nr:tRNA (adenosine(37)-N6)-threonylcarbamoyltransferase complex ATPase subunit type 1 TsaE [Planctomycetia bacterium]